MLLSLLLCASIAPLALSLPLKRQAPADLDLTVLQFALTLEHLESAFYTQAMATLTPQHFADAGFGSNYLANLGSIAADEAAHVSFLSTAITAAGATPVAPCTYNFAIPDVPSFIALSAVLEGVGTSAYLGAAPLLTSKDILAAAGSILVTEALHTSLQRVALKAAPGGTPFGTPLGPASVFTLAASFIAACPAENAPLPFTAFASLAVASPAVCFCEGPDCSPSVFQKVKRGHPGSPSASASATATYQPASASTGKVCKAKTAATEACRPPSAGTPASFTAASAVPPGSFLTFVSGVSVSSVAGEISDTTITAAIPQGVAGQSYVLVTSVDAGAAGKVDDATVLFGPAILEVQPSPPSGAPPAVRRG